MGNFICDRAVAAKGVCGFVTDSLNSYLAHNCCRHCGYVAQYENIARDTNWDMQRHMKEQHKVELVRERTAQIKFIKRLIADGDKGKAQSVQEWWGITDDEL